MERERLDQVLETLWQDFCAITPDACRIHAMLAVENPRILTDHLTLHTFGLPRVNITQLVKPFERAGYRACGEFDFAVHKLIARHYEHPDKSLPRLLLTELNIDSLGDEVRNILHQLISQIPQTSLQQDDFCSSGRHWKIDYGTYQQLLQCSEYAAWVAAFGFRANHFSVLVNSLTSLASIDDLNDYLLEQGFRLNSVGGLVQGSPDEYLEQSSTLTSTVEVQFSDRRATVSGCRYEFIRRYPQADGRLYPGYLPMYALRQSSDTDMRSRNY